MWWHAAWRGCVIFQVAAPRTEQFCIMTRVAAIVCQRLGEPHFSYPATASKFRDQRFLSIDTAAANFSPDREKRQISTHWSALPTPLFKETASSRRGQSKLLRRRTLHSHFLRHPDLISTLCEVLRESQRSSSGVPLVLLFLFIKNSDDNRTVGGLDQVRSSLILGD